MYEGNVICLGFSSNIWKMITSECVPEIIAVIAIAAAEVAYLEEAPGAQFSEPLIFHLRLVVHNPLYKSNYD